MIDTLIDRLRYVCLVAVLLMAGGLAYAQVMPAKPQPPALVNDMAHMMTDGEQRQLERKLDDFARETSNQITIVTIDSLGDYDVSDYAIKLGKAWGIGKSGRNNGVVILASLKDHKINISTGQGLEGALTDLMCGRIIRNEMVPAFKEKNYYEGFSKAADAVLAATRGEYKADPSDRQGRKHSPGAGIIIFIIVIVFVIFMRGRGGGGSGGGNYISGGGAGNFLTGMMLGGMLGGRGGGFGGGGGDSSGGGGGFGGFGGGDFGGGGASGSW
jgi:uncharacterized protein